MQICARSWDRNGRRPAGSYHSEQYREPAQPDRDLCGDYFADA